MTCRDPDAQRRRALWALLAFICLTLGFSHQAQVLEVPRLGHLLLPYDSDSWRRLVIVREWLAGGSFFDHAVPRVNAPSGEIETHWTRFLDLLLAGVTKLMPPSLTLDQRLMLAATWYPLALVLAAAALLNRAASRTKSAQHLLCILALGLFSTVPGDYFAPGNADHHGTLSTLWCAVLALMARPPGRRAALGLGLVLGCMTWISVEALVPAASVYAILGVRALLQPRAAESLSITTATAAGVAALALLLQQPYDALSHIAYDSLSIVHVLLLSLCAAAALALQVVLPRLPDLRRRIAAAASAAARVLAVMAATFPKFFRGPRVDADAFISQSFLPMITEARPLFALPWQTAFSALWQPALAALLLAVTWGANIWRRDRWRQSSLTALLVFTFLPLLMEIRWNYYLQPTAVVIIAALLPAYISAARIPVLCLLPREHRTWLALWALLLSVSVFTRLTGQEVLNTGEICSLDQEYALQSRKAQALLGDKPLVLLASANVSGTVLFFTPYSVIAGNYDREAEGLKDIADIDGAKTPEEARPLLLKRHVGALLTCPSLYSKDSWVHRLSDGKGRPAWVKSLGVIGTPDKNSAPLMLFRISPSATGTGSKHPSAAG
jgi:hypothetical protein